MASFRACCKLAMDHAKKPAKQGFAAFGFTKIDAKAHQQVIERQVAEGAGKRHVLEPANSAGVRAAVAPRKPKPGHPKGPRIPVHEVRWKRIPGNADHRQLKRETEAKKHRLYHDLLRRVGFAWLCLVREALRRARPDREDDVPVRF